MAFLSDREIYADNGEPKAEIACPHCGYTNILTGYKTGLSIITCQKCKASFDNPNVNRTTTEKAKERRKQGDGIRNQQNGRSKSNFWGWVFLLAVFTVGCFFVKGSDVEADGQTVYLMTKDFYAPADKATHDHLKKEIGKNYGDQYGMNMAYLETMYNYNFNHFFRGDEVIVIRKHMDGSLFVRKCQTMESGVILSADYLIKK